MNIQNICLEKYKILHVSLSPSDLFICCLFDIRFKTIQVEVCSSIIETIGL